MKNKIFVNKFTLVKYALKHKLSFDLYCIEKFYEKLTAGNFYFKQSLLNKHDDYFIDIQQGDDFGVKTTFVELRIFKNWSQQQLIELVSLAHFLYPDSLNIEVFTSMDKNLNRN